MPHCLILPYSSRVLPVRRKNDQLKNCAVHSEILNIYPYITHSKALTLILSRHIFIAMMLRPILSDPGEQNETIDNNNANG
jgi:hypothetical protein